MNGMTAVKGGDGSGPQPSAPPGSREALQLVTIMFQNMFPAIDVSTVREFRGGGRGGRGAEEEGGREGRGQRREGAEEERV